MRATTIRVVLAVLAALVSIPTAGGDEAPLVFVLVFGIGVNQRL